MRDFAVERAAAARLLDYPDAAFRQRLPLVAGAVSELDGSPARAGLEAALGYIAAADPGRLESAYVDVFDLKRRRTLHLTYYADGDTRRRGPALARLKRVYAASGWACDGAELPDHLGVVLEFAARGDAAAGHRLLVEFRSAIELLRGALHEHGTGYRHVLDAVAATLPPPDGAEVRRLAADGPPAEGVGVEPQVMLGMPTRVAS
ncbi:MAG TPA: nitrate reductase molybdenum cofactor assembly chaperone [Stackebrandtia sp.]|nr:nitrate reductase molybdenum cofactor assembly chaperone [Stackebrandtia sp.]HZE39574.1 nitrate reductase molybdenum cofactor assembly chaperone [Stackebrandtia sp.]